MKKDDCGVVAAPPKYTMANTCDRIEEHLWLGDRHTFTSSENGRFQAIVTAMLEEEVRDYQIKESVGGRNWHHVVVDDDERQDISQYFLEVVKFIENAREQNQTVLVHCAGGISRSATLMAAYLMWKHRWTRRQAIEHISRQRKIIQPNDGFMDQLLVFERVVRQLPPQNNIPIDQHV